MKPAASARETVLFELVRALEHAGTYNAQDQSAPAAIVWTDKERQWGALAPRLHEVLPQLFTLGANGQIHCDEMLLQFAGPRFKFHRLIRATFGCIATA